MDEDSPMSASFKEVYRLSLQLSEEDRRRLADYLVNPPPPLDPRRIVATLTAHADTLRAMGVERIGVFGSHVRGEAGPASDVDILVKLAQSSFRDFMRLKFYLEELLARPVDLVLEESLREELRPTILSEVLYAEGI
jgi:hypothetical protein